MPDGGERIAMGSPWPHAFGTADRHHVLAPSSSGSPILAPAPEPLRIEVSILGSFALRVGGERQEALSLGTKRLLAFLALRDRTVARTAIAGTMWTDTPEPRALMNLRSALSRLEAPARQAVVVNSAGLGLADNVAIDFRDSLALAQRLLQPDVVPRDADLSPAAVSALGVELLPDWYDNWVVTDAEEWRQLRIHALEAQVRQLAGIGRLAGAARAARAAIRADPLRGAPRPA